MNNVLKVILLIITAVYVISPIDLYPGMIDDVIVAILGIVGNIALSRKNNR